jgi:hypothetical protein
MLDFRVVLSGSKFAASWVQIPRTHSRLQTNPSSDGNDSTSVLAGHCEIAQLVRTLQVLDRISGSPMK